MEWRKRQSNGMAEKAVHIIKMMLKKVDTEQDLDLALLDYRSTPVPGIGYSPAEMLMSRRLRTRLPVRENQLGPNIPNNLPLLLQRK